MKKIVLLYLCLLVAGTSLAQVTASTIIGQVTDDKGPLPGSTVVAIHLPSGSKYGVSTNSDGRFTMPNVRIGGPYYIEVSFVGYQTSKAEGIMLKLGQTFVYDVKLEQTTTELEEVIVAADRNAQMSDKTGASTSIGITQLTSMPTISRSITDFTRLTPQSNGTSFAGRDGRYNNIQVDGANLNNNFGLSSDPLPGGGSSPISLDAYEEVTVNIAPFDVRQSGFTGAGINAVTKSGTNTIKGTAYTLFRNQSFQGTKVGSNDISNQVIDSKNNIYGLAVGGPIIKNKLFFFVNAEQEKGSRPGITFSPTGGSGNGNVSSTPADSLAKFSNYLNTKFGYQTGAYDNFPNFQNKNTKLLMKLDYNINQDHRLTFKYSDFNSTNDQPLNGSSVPNGGGFSVTGRTGTLARLPFNRFSNTSMSFANSNFAFEDKVKTGTLELNSNFKGKASNQFLTTLTRIRTTRTFGGPVFPTIDVFDGSGNNYMSAGMDPFTNNNDVINNIFTLTDNFTYYLGKHTITAGASYEQQKVGNMFMAASNSYYAFNSLNDLVNDKPPVYYAYTYSLVPGQKAVYSAELKVAQLGIYAQDEFNVNNVKLTIGLRADKPIYLQSPIENPAVSALQFYNKNDNLINYSNGSWPKSPMLISPRVGARWDAKKDRSLILRGGAGLFTGKIPFVFLTNMPTNSGMYQFGSRLRNSNAGEAAQLANITLSANPDQYANLFPTTAGTSAPGSLVFIDKNFKFPQILRTNFAVDKTLPYGLTATFEALITKDVNAVNMVNVNMPNATTGVVTEGGLSRPRFVTSADRALNSSVSNAILLKNNNKGFSSAYTFQLSKAFDKGFYGTVAYTYTKSKEVTANPGSQASSVWNANPNVGTSNAVELANSQYAIPNRVIANISYKLDYAKHMASTFSLFYQGSSQGVYSFVVNGDLNNDGNSSTDLMYIPKNTSEMNFEDYTQTINGNAVTFTAAQQQAACEQFINNSSYLKKHRGEFAGRNAATLPWFNELDLRFLQEFYIVSGSSKTKHTLQVSLDIFNFANMLSKNWGTHQFAATTNPLTFRSINNTTENKPLYRWQNINGSLVTDPFQDSVNLGSTWSMQLGVRYIF